VMLYVGSLVYHTQKGKCFSTENHVSVRRLLIAIKKNCIFKYKIEKKIDMPGRKQAAIENAEKEEEGEDTTEAKSHVKIVYFEANLFLGHYQSAISHLLWLLFVISIHFFVHFCGHLAW
jgi:hypothetical protein